MAALFALHPLHVESVAWIAERRDVLSGLFFMLTLGAYEDYVRHPRSLWRYLVVVGLFALGLLAKPMLVTLPPLLLLLDYWPLGTVRPHGRTPPAAGSRPALSLALRAWKSCRWWRWPWPRSAMTIWCHDVAEVQCRFTLSERLANAAISYVAYLGQLFVPLGLSLFYSYPDGGLAGLAGCRRRWCCCWRSRRPR